MSRLFPLSPAFSDKAPSSSHEWIAPSVLRRNHYDVYKKLPPGKPDCLRVDILHFDDGVERCTTAIYGERAYLIHYTFAARTVSK